MSYLVLARKYRPQTFEDVVEQAHVTQTLKNAIQSERVAHAMLFSGPRGTGKTTIARILAKAMNCETGPSPTPCNKCRSCTEITNGNAVDVFEIDGASNNGVDNIRDLRDNVRYMPVHSRYKIYIIDEVHMLSTAAFNALLKTLEEPPAHILFFFATTEPHKIPITILSRCQQHDLRRIDLSAVSAHLAGLCKQEQIEIPMESLDLIAREAGGSMRDALSLLDQLMVCSQGEITHEQTTEILGVVDRKRLFELSWAVLSGDAVRILKIIEELYDQGYALKEFYTVMLEHFRNLLMMKMGRQAQELVDAPSHELQQMAEQVQNVSPVHLSQLLDVFFKEESSIRFSTQPKLALEMAFIRLFQIRPALPIDTVIQKLDDLSKGIVEASPALLNASQPPAGTTEVRERGAALVSSRQPAAEQPDQVKKKSDNPSPQSAETEPSENVRTEPAEPSPPKQGESSVSSTQVKTEAEKPSPKSVEAVPSANSQTEPSESSPTEQADISASSDQMKPELENPSAQLKEAEADFQTQSDTAAPSPPKQDESPAAPSQMKSETGPPSPQQENAVPSIQSQKEPAASEQTEPSNHLPQMEEKEASAFTQQPEAPLPPDHQKTAAAQKTASAQQDAAPFPQDFQHEPGETAESAWEKLTAMIEKESPAMSSSLSRCRLASMTENALVIESMGSAFDVKQINKRKKALQSICSTFFGREMELTIRQSSGSAPKKKPRSTQIQEAKNAAASHPLVSDAIEIFNGTLIDVKML